MNSITATLIVEAPALAEALNTLAKAISGSNSINTQGTAAPSEFSAAVLPTEIQVQAPLAPTQAPQLVPTAAPVQLPSVYAPTYYAPQQPAPAYTPLQPVPNAASIFTSQQQAPTAPIQAAPSPVPTSVPDYTIEQIQLATAPLIDAGRLGELQVILKNFGLNSLLELPKERYPDFANALRSLGGKI